jgi:hypothetical protein
VVSVKKVVWFALGIAGGFVLAHLMNKDPRGHELLAQVDSRIDEFTDRMGEAYRDQESRFAGLVAGARQAASDAADTVRDAAHDAADRTTSD